jgi:trans-aconitate methyltransferase
MDDATRAARVSSLDDIAEGYDPSNAAEQFDYWLKRLQARAIANWLLGRRVLELGCATGELTSLLAPLSEGYHVVEGSATNVEAARRRVPNATFVHSLWEDYRPDRQFSDVVAANAIEHAPDPVGLLEVARRWIEPDGLLHVVVPNGLSLHRLVGTALEILPEPLYLSDGDAAQGHYRNYTLDTLLAELSSAGLRCRHWQPVFLKVLPNHRMLDWDWELIKALDEVAHRIPEHGAELYLVCEPASA